MKIEIDNNIEDIDTQRLLAKFLKINKRSLEKYDYLKDENIFIGHNRNSGYSYIYLENSPNLCICLDPHKEYVVVYNSSLDGLEYEKELIENSLSDLEDTLQEAWELDDKRADDYENEKLKQAFDDAMLANGWVNL